MNRRRLRAQAHPLRQAWGVFSSLLSLSLLAALHALALWLLTVTLHVLMPLVALSLLLVLPWWLTWKYHKHRHHRRAMTRQAGPGTAHRAGAVPVTATTTARRVEG